MPRDPAIPIAGGSLSLGAFADPLLVDPGPSLLSAVVETYREAAPDLVDPDLHALRSAASDGPEPIAARAGLPSLTVLASSAAFDSVTKGFRDASRLAALATADVIDLLTLADPQPNALLAGDETGCVLVGVAGEEDARWRRVGDDPTLRDRYERTVSDADPYRIDTPSRCRVYAAFEERCGRAVATDAVRLLDPGPDLSATDPVGPRTRAYVVGARHRTHDRTLRRACEDAGLGSPSTFTRIKRRLIDAGLVETERVARPVGRPRERVVAADPLSGPPIERVADVLRESLGE
ncbi:transcriptional regulator TbsP domain-containing protein [Halorubrum cibi]|uniref:Uncharacterized protein n=1 Tax=Halorubrum cibi TaxID=413815 RepID=A0A521DDK1_9EURY|nr:DUF5821 family protein [Halorubrum cibi]SMO69769.1 hypothetical protein SAMN06264867_106206 [Halorubrum cibi]